MRGTFAVQILIVEIPSVATACQMDIANSVISNIPIQFRIATARIVDARGRLERQRVLNAVVVYVDNGVALGADGGRQRRIEVIEAETGEVLFDGRVGAGCVVRNAVDRDVCVAAGNGLRDLAEGLDRAADRRVFKATGSALPL